MFVQHVECGVTLRGLVQFDYAVEGTDSVRIYRPGLQAARNVRKTPKVDGVEARCRGEGERTAMTRLRRSKRESQDTTSKRTSPPRVSRDTGIWS